MKKLLFFLFFLISAASMAQENQSTSNVLGKRYFGVQHEYRGNEWTLSNGELTHWTEPLMSITHFVYGQRLKKRFYFETGLSYYFRSDRSDVISNNGFTPVLRTTLLSSHAFIIPLAIRYRSKGEQWRFTTGATLADIGLALARSNTLTREIVSGPNESVKKNDPQFLAFLGLGLEVGCEYQLAPNWMIRADSQLGIGFSSSNISYTPNLRVGLFKSINR
ncbi:MAG: hypothetical protein C0424_12690 [Sphingobacteriaceae bacterium]|nr:hypothetical protein [Sphingobacteriaceae bacterium]